VHTGDPAHPTPTAPPAPPSLARHRRHAGDPTVTSARWSPSSCPECAAQRRDYGRWLGGQRRAGQAAVVDAATSRSLLVDLCAVGLTVPEVARLTGLDRAHLRRVLTGRTRRARVRTEAVLLDLASRVTTGRPQTPR
jgi:hypothetical protein